MQKQTNEPKVFTFTPTSQPIRVVFLNNDFYFIAADVYAVLNLSNPTLDEDEKLTMPLILNGPEVDVMLITECGLYSLIIDSTHRHTKLFCKWITTEVLPTLRNQTNTDGVSLMQLIERCLYHGDQTEVAKELNVSIHMVNRVLKGDKKSLRIITALYNKAVENYNFEQETSKKLLEIIRFKQAKKGGRNL